LFFRLPSPLTHKELLQAFFFRESRYLKEEASGVIMNSVIFALLVACVAGLAQGFVPTSLGSAAEVQRQNYRVQALNVRMQGDGRTDRRSILLRGALPAKCHIFDLPSAVCYRFDENYYRTGGVLAVLPLITAAPASAQFGGGIPNPADLIGNPRGDRPGGLGPIGRYLSLCDSENCVSTSDDVYRYFCPPPTLVSYPRPYPEVSPSPDPPILYEDFRRGEETSPSVLEKRMQAFISCSLFTDVLW